MLITLAHWQLTTRCQMVLGKTNSKHLIHKNNLWRLTFNNLQMFILCPCVLCSKSEIPSQGISSFSSPQVPLYFMLIAKQKICYYSHEISQFSNLFWPKLFQSLFSQKTPCVTSCCFKKCSFYEIWIVALSSHSLVKVNSEQF